MYMYTTIEPSKIVSKHRIVRAEITLNLDTLLRHGRTPTIGIIPKMCAPAMTV